jgi:hypothetical protein
MRARDYAISLGLAQPGRGKLSKKAHAAIQEAIDNGQTFEDYADGKVVRNGSVPSSGSSVRKTVPGDVIGSVNLDSDSTERTSEQIRIPGTEARTHDYSTVWGLDPELNVPIAFQSCAKCFRQVAYCLHDMPQLPAYIGGGNALMERP